MMMLNADDVGDDDDDGGDGDDGGDDDDNDDGDDSDDGDGDDDDSDGDDGDDDDDDDDDDDAPPDLSAEAWARVDAGTASLEEQLQAVAIAEADPAFRADFQRRVAAMDEATRGLRRSDMRERPADEYPGGRHPFLR